MSLDLGWAEEDPTKDLKRSHQGDQGEEDAPQREKSTVQNGGKKRSQQRLTIAPQHDTAPLGTLALGTFLAGEGKIHLHSVAVGGNEEQVSGWFGLEGGRWQN